MRKRPVIVAVENDIDGEDARITVTLDWNERSWHGSAVGSSEVSPRLAGEATLDAVHQLTEGRVTAELLAVATTDLGVAQIALAQVKYGTEETLVGSALQGEADGRLAAVRAVLDAINRRLELAL